MTRPVLISEQTKASSDPPGSVFYIDASAKKIYIIEVDIIATRRRIEAVITGRTRNAFALRGTRVRIPPSPLKKLYTSGVQLFRYSLNSK